MLANKVVRVSAYYVYAFIDLKRKNPVLTFIFIVYKPGEIQQYFKQLEWYLLKNINHIKSYK